MTIIHRHCKFLYWNSWTAKLNSLNTAVSLVPRAMLCLARMGEVNSLVHEMWLIHTNIMHRTQIQNRKTWKVTLVMGLRLSDTYWASWEIPNIALGSETGYTSDTGYAFKLRTLVQKLLSWYVYNIITHPTIWLAVHALSWAKKFNFSAPDYMWTGRSVSLGMRIHSTVTLLLLPPESTVPSLVARFLVLQVGSVGGRVMHILVHLSETTKPQKMW